MDQRIQTILNDLYQIDQDFKQYEKQLVKIIDRLIKVRPDTEFDEEFKNRLRQELLAKIEELSANKKIKKTASWLALSFNKLAYAGLGAIIVIIIALPTFFWSQSQMSGSNGLSLEFDAKVGINSLANQAFGSLVATPSQEILADGRGAGDGSGLATNYIGIPEIVGYKFVYTGDNFTIDDAEMNVFKRIKTSANASMIANLISRLKFDLIDLSKLSNPKMQSLGLMEDRDYGYLVTIDFQENNVSVSQNYTQGETAVSRCAAGERCIDQPLSIDDVSNDSDLISQANDFVNKYAIDLSPYGQPQVEDSWRQFYETDSSNVPDIINVIYPLLIDNKTVLDESGNLFGMRVGINIRENKVIGLWNHSTNNYQASRYPVEQNVSRLLEIATTGNAGNHALPGGTSEKVLEAEIGTPEIGLVKIYRFNDNTKENEELIIPALVFPVTKIPENTSYFQKNLVVPLIKEILDRYEQTTSSLPKDLPQVKPIPATPAMMTN
ncbi:MAG TPA: hypothetical protein PKL09_01510 [bacterium]|nr:hypothetical protein [bacterium]HNS33650.1 hypothetical protein [bacterium]HNZ73206.1 hypothetical protein [bacterium]HOH67104.1 hypothetical protein [bacterium]